MKVFISGRDKTTILPAVEHALSAGHQVTALVANSVKIKFNHPNLTILRGDILQPHTFASSLRGQDVVISATGFAKANLLRYNPNFSYSQGSASLLSSMELYGVNRFFCVSPSEVRVSPALPWSISVIARCLIYKLLKHRYADVRRMEQIVRNSKADWTIIRPSRLTDGPSTGKYRTAVNLYLTNALSYRVQIWLTS
jgi:putative NADH-flavin reductase